MFLIEAISNAFGAVKEFFGFRREQQVLQNSPEMQGNAKAAQDAELVDQARKDVAAGDTDAIRKGLS